MKVKNPWPLSALLWVLLIALPVSGVMAAPPKTVTKAHQPEGKPTKARSFAPRPTKSRVFGAPIQPPIVGRAPPKKPQPH